MGSTVIWRTAVVLALFANAATTTIFGLQVHETRVALNDHDSAAATMLVGLNNKQVEIVEAIRGLDGKAFVAIDKASYASNTAANTLSHVIGLKADVERLKTVAHGHLIKTTEEPR